MASEYEHGSPDVKALVVHMNEPYTTLISKLTECMLGIANDVNAIVVKDKDGNAHKTVMDSTEDGVIPENSIVFIDSDGKATYDSDFSVDISSALIQFPLPFTLAFGDQSSDGSMRIRVTTDGIYFGKLVTGSWNEVSLTA